MANMINIPYLAAIKAGLIWKMETVHAAKINLPFHSTNFDSYRLYPKRVNGD
jgi:hypothetical protein